MGKAIDFLVKFPLFYYCFWVNVLFYFILPFPTISASKDDQLLQSLTKAGFLTSSALPPSSYIINRDDLNRFLSPSASPPSSYGGNNDMRQHINYGALNPNGIPCYRLDGSYLCRLALEPANDYSRGCNPATHCRQDPPEKKHYNRW